MRVDSGESDRLAVRQAFARELFSDLVWHISPDAVDQYWKSVEVPHTVFYSYEEVLAPFKDDAHDPKTVLAALLRLTRYLTDSDVSDFQLPISPEQRQAFLGAFAETSLRTETIGPKEGQGETEEQALVRTAEAALAQLTDAEQTIAKRVFGRLVRLGAEDEGGGYFPIRVNVGEFTEPEREVIRKLASHRVVTFVTPRPSAREQYSSSLQRSAEETVGIADSRLVRVWRTLLHWLEEDRDFLMWRQQLRTYLTDWERSGRDRAAMLSGRLLSVADLALLRRPDDLNATETHYIAESRAANIVTPGQEVTRRSPRASARARRWVWAGILVGIIVVLTILDRTLGQIEYLPLPPVHVPQLKGPVRVPQLTGISSARAARIAEGLGLKTVMTDGALPDAPFVQGVVIDQAPAAQLTLPPGGKVRLTVGAGVITVPIGEGQVPSLAAVVTPTIIGMNLTEALNALVNVGLKLGRTESRYVSDARLDTVITQIPAAGTPARADGSVDVVVARAPKLSDFRIEVYFVEGNLGLQKLAERLRVVMRQAGAECILYPRSEQFFAGRLRPKRHEIRYSSIGDRQAILELQRLLNDSGDFPAFAPTPVRQQSEGVIAIVLAS
jgi:Novel STAND NTPase 1/PASTA domain